jgi:predicted RNA binding protein YcfA (HicA-like mRNA interferase family)
MANGRVTVIPVHKGREIKKGLFIAILKQLQIDIDAFIVFIK